MKRQLDIINLRKAEYLYLEGSNWEPVVPGKSWKSADGFLYPHFDALRIQKELDKLG